MVYTKVISSVLGCSWQRLTALSHAFIASISLIVINHVNRFCFSAFEEYVYCLEPEIGYCKIDQYYSTIQYSNEKSKFIAPPFNCTVPTVVYSFKGIENAASSAGLHFLTVLVLLVCMCANLWYALKIGFSTTSGIIFNINSNYGFQRLTSPVFYIFIFWWYTQIYKYLCACVDKIYRFRDICLKRSTIGKITLRSIVNKISAAEH